MSLSDRSLFFVIQKNKKKQKNPEATMGISTLHISTEENKKPYLLKGIFEIHRKCLK